MRVIRNESFVPLLAHAASWNALAGGNPFRRWEWVTRWWEEYGDNNELVVLTVHDDREELIGAAPWFRSQSKVAGRAIECIGCGEVCSDYLGVMAKPGLVDNVAQLLGDWLLNANSASGSPEERWDLLHLTGIERTDCTTASLVAQLVDAGCVAHRREGIHCWRLRLPETWEAYEELLSKSHRKQVRRIDRRVLQSGRARLRVARSTAELEEALPILIRLHQARRQSLGQPGCFASDRFRRFIHATARDVLSMDGVRIYWLEIDGTSVAAEIHWLAGGVSHAYQGGVDPDALDDEPGRAITIAILKQLIEERQTALDFLRGDEPYKAHFRAEKQPLEELRIVAPKGMAQIRHGVWWAGDAIRGFVKSSLNLSGMR